MKVAILSDIHGNLPALTAVVDHITRWQPDHVIVNGDVVNCLPQSRACWEFVRSQPSWIVLRGNNEEYLAEWQGVAQPDTLTRTLSGFSYATYQDLNGDVEPLLRLPTQTAVSAPDGTTLFATHASVLGSRDGIFADSPAHQLRQQTAVDTDTHSQMSVFVTAHTHQPFIRQFNRLQVVNIGSVGLPMDGDRRASYGRFTWDTRHGWRAEIVRVDYDWQETIDIFKKTNFAELVGPLAMLSLAELRDARDYKTNWAQTYRQQVIAGYISAADSVAKMLPET